MPAGIPGLPRGPLVHGLRLLGFGAGVIAALVAAGKQSGPVDAAALATDLLLLLSHHVLVKADAGGAVALVWLVVAGGGRWLPEPTWVDRAGRVLGVTWLVLMPVTSPAMFLG